MNVLTGTGPSHVSVKEGTQENGARKKSMAVSRSLVSMLMQLVWIWVWESLCVSVPLGTLVCCVKLILIHVIPTHASRMKLVSISLLRTIPAMCLSVLL